jgi:hypothetical protein
MPCTSINGFFEVTGQGQQGVAAQHGGFGAVAGFADHRADGAAAVPAVVVLPFGGAGAGNAGGVQLGLGEQGVLGLEAAEAPAVEADALGVHAEVGRAPAGRSGCSADP